jgi:hypothetical protein
MTDLSVGRNVEGKTREKIIGSQNQPSLSELSDEWRIQIIDPVMTIVRVTIHAILNHLDQRVGNPTEEIRIKWVVISGAVHWVPIRTNLRMEESYNKV